MKKTPFCEKRPLNTKETETGKRDLEKPIGFICTKKRPLETKDIIH